MVVLCLFCLELLVCVALGWPIVAALLVGLVLFVGWALRQGYGLRAVGGMLWSGIRTAKNVLIVFLLIGVLTALWRACGTVPLLICYAVDLIHPGTLVITSFLLASAVSALMGTSFGAAATMGAVCMTAAASMGVSPVLAGGAVLSGAFFGDRCSPVSTSALLISELTHTDIYDNLRAMVRTAFVPFALTCAVYAVLGAMAHGGGAAQDVRALFARVCTLHWLTLLPAVLILVLSALHVHVRWVMCASIAAAFTLCLTVQHQPLADVLRCMLTGYVAPDAAAGALLNGGVVVSMLRVTAIVCISAAYSGIFQATGLLGTAKAGIARMSRRHVLHGRRRVHDRLQPDALHPAHAPALRRYGAGRPVVRHRPGKLRRRACAARSVVNRGCSAARLDRRAGAEPAGRVLSLPDPAVLARLEAPAPPACCCLT